MESRFNETADIGIIYQSRSAAKTKSRGLSVQRGHVTNVGATIPKACGFEAATRFSPILIGWQPHPDCRYRDGDGSFRPVTMNQRAKTATASLYRLFFAVAA